MCTKDCKAVNPAVWDRYRGRPPARLFGHLLDECAWNTGSGPSWVLMVGVGRGRNSLDPGTPRRQEIPGRRVREFFPRRLSSTLTLTDPSAHWDEPAALGGRAAPR